jgi:hypothetical protein
VLQLDLYPKPASRQARRRDGYPLCDGVLGADPGPFPATELISVVLISHDHFELSGALWRPEGSGDCRFYAVLRRAARFLRTSSMSSAWA